MKRYLITLIALAACTADAPKTAADSAKALADSNTTAARNAVVPPGEQPAPPPRAPAADDVAAGEWQVTPAGIGSVKAGMTLEEANIVLHGNLVIPAKLEECGFVRLKNRPDGIMFMTEKDVIARVDITKGDIATVEGAKIGDTEARIKSLYPGVATQPHKYTDGHYLVVTPKSGGPNRIIFETDGSKVTRYRSGKMPQVEYVEGCS